jgi:D-alanyl-lipoteichoic acid acyltransferase DltB (MBOAT superfamily)
VNFVSYSFVVLLAAAVFARVLVGQRKTEPAYVWTLLALSLTFYGWHVPGYLGILLFSALVDYAAGLALGRMPPPSVAAAADLRRRRWVLVASLSTNLGLLAFFKYANFGIDALQQVLAAAGLGPGWGRLDLVLPMGISFYTFQSMSYTIDVYRGVLAPLASFRDFLLYIAFFPQLVAGPIVRATEFLPQLARVRRARLQVVNEALFLMASGFFLKMVCADNLAAQVDAHWADGYAAGTSGPMLVLLTLLFSGQIFCDFAGYSNIARGTALLLGYRLPLNFNAPYIAGSFRNFWERWHMTLSRWLRDYLYVSLGGNRISPVRTYVNLLLVMLLGGLWHGAAFTFVAWGALHGVALAVERALGLERAGAGASGALRRAGWFVVVQVVVLVTWVLFRSETLAGGWQFLVNIAAWHPGAVPLELWYSTVFLVPVVLLHAWRWLEERGTLAPLAAVPRAALAGAMAATIAMAYGSTNAFIYFQF